MSTFKYYKNGRWNYVNGAITGDTLPIGGITLFAGTTAPTGWLICDGSYVSKTTYAELYSAIGDDFLDGGTAPTGTFRLPNYEGRVPVGVDPNDTDFNTIGKTGGEKKHTLTTSEMPSHNHMEKIYSKNYNDNKSLSGNRAYARSFADVTGGWNYTVNGETGGQIVDLIETGNSGSGQAHNNVQPYQTVNYIIKASQSAGVVGNVSNTQSDSTTDTYSCDYINGKFSPQTIVDAGNNWKKVDLGICKIYFTTRESVNSMTYSAGGWGYAFGILLPTNISKFDANKMTFNGNIRANDNAITLFAGINNNNTSISVNYVNHYSTGITCACAYNLTIIDFS